jgi:hypothetical protein
MERGNNNNPDSENPRQGISLLGRTLLATIITRALLERDHDLAREFFSIREGGETENEDEEEDEENPHQTLFIRRIRAEQESNEDQDDDSEESDEGYPSELDYDCDLSDIALATYGQIGNRMYQSMSREKLLSSPFPLKHLPEKLLEFFLTNITCQENINFVNIKRFMACLPSLDELRDFVQLKTRPSVKEVILMRLTLDFYDMYTALFDRPPHREYTFRVLPLLISFYSNISDLTFKSMKIEFRKLLVRSKADSSLKKIFWLLPDKKAFLTKYKNIQRDLTNLNEGLAPNTFIV